MNKNKAVTDEFDINDEFFANFMNSQDPFKYVQSLAATPGKTISFFLSDDNNIDQKLNQGYSIVPASRIKQSQTRYSKFKEEDKYDDDYPIFVGKGRMYIAMEIDNDLVARYREHGISVTTGRLEGLYGGDSSKEFGKYGGASFYDPFGSALKTKEQLLRN